ncbi:MAG TPA: SCO family protein [Vicinamibacterales bacterium]|nr:SCO family protein [Vicinamibacterales bacterium]
MAELQWQAMPPPGFPLILLLALAACSRERRYPLEGHILIVDPARQELTVKHGDVKGFMPGMTMPFKVSGATIAERKPGDVIRATLVVSDSSGHLENVVKTGEAALPLETPATPGVRMLEPGAEAPETRFVDQAGRARQLSEWRGTTVAVTFVYTRCPLPDFCPLMDRHFASVQRAVLQDASLARSVHLLSVSVDPDYDTPAVLRDHARRAGADPRTWTWLTGPRGVIAPFAHAFGVSTIRDGTSTTEIVHNLRTAVIDRHGMIASIVSGNDWTPDTLLADLRAAHGR